MFATLKQARAALNHLNPAEVRSAASRTVRVGLIATDEAGYSAMEQALAPASSGHEEQLRGKSEIFRGGDPDAPANVDVVLYEEGLQAPKGTYVLYVHDLARTVGDVLRDDESLELPLARQFPGLRTHIVDRIIQAIAKENALFAFATALPDVIPSPIEIPWVFGEWASDTAFLTANQVRMAFMISAACGRETGFATQKGQLLSIAASAFGWRAIARELAGKIPLGGGLIAKGAIAYAGTYVVGKSLELYQFGENHLPGETKRNMYRDALERGREIVRSLAQPRT